MFVVPALAGIAMQCTPPKGGTTNYVTENSQLRDVIFERVN